MGIGPKIKEFRNKEGLTQKDLADKLHVTYQAVSRWENDDAEPSIDTIKEMCGILNCSIEELFEMENNEEDRVENNTLDNMSILEEHKPMLAVCERCNNPIYESVNLNRITETYIGTDGNQIIQRILCNDCNEIRLAEEKREKEEEQKKNKESLRERRINSFILATIFAVAFIITGIASFVERDVETGLFCLVVAVLSYFFVATMALNNTFIPDLWLEIASWGFVELPGIIFDISIGGLIFLIVVKILFFILGIILAVLAIIFATILSMILSVFVYPFALRKNLKDEERGELEEICKKQIK